MNMRYLSSLLLLVFLLTSSPGLFAADSDCIENGGKALCTKPIYGSYVYGGCVNNSLSTTENAESYCGTQVGPITSDEGMKAWIACLPVRQYSACSVDPIQINWLPQGTSDSTYSFQCWTMAPNDASDFAAVNPTYIGHNSTNGACDAAGGYYPVVVRKDRPLTCPLGYSSRTTASGDAECWKMTVAPQCGNQSQPAGELCGNPMQPVTGKKLQVETDYIGPGGLRFVRTYNSHGYYRPLYAHEIDPYPLGQKWTHNYQQRVYPTQSSSSVMAVVVRPDGDFKYFKPDGSEYFNTGASDILAIVSGGWRYTRTDGLIENYGSDGKLSTINDHGRILTMQYSDGSTPSSIAPGAGFLIQVTDDSGHHLGFRYDNNGRLLALKDPSGVETTYGFDGPSAITSGNPIVSRLTTVTYPDSTTRTYYYNESNFTGSSNQPQVLTGLVDENGQRFANWWYNGGGAVIRSEHLNGVEQTTINYATNAYGVQNATGQTISYYWQSIGGVAHAYQKNYPCIYLAGQCPTQETFAYDSVTGDLQTRTDRNGYTTSYVFDSTRHLETSRTEAVGTPRERTITTQWHPTFDLPIQVDEPGRRTTTSYDSFGNVLSKTITDIATNNSRTWTYAYNSLGQILTADGPRTDVSDITTYTYYSCTTGAECGQLHTITDAAGNVTTFNTYNAHGQPLSITDPNNVVTTLAYDARQRLSSQTIGTEATTLDYWPTGLLKKVTLPDGSYLSYIYDSAHRLTEIDDGLGNRIVYTLDVMSNRTKEEVKDSSGVLARTMSRTFDLNNRLSQEIGAAGTAAVTTTFGYDKNGNQITIAEPLGRNTANQYDELNRLKQVTDPANGVAKYGYNGTDDLTSVTDPRNLQTLYSYSGLGDLIQVGSPDTGTSVNTYDSGGNLQTSKDARNKTGTYSFDALNRITQLAYSDQTITYQYDQGTNGKGHLTQVTDGSGSTQWTYSLQGRALTKQQATTGKTFNVAYGYNSAGQLASITTPSNEIIGYSYTNNQITSVTLNGTTILNQVLYAPFGPTRGWVWGNGTSVTRGYDLDGRIITNSSAGSSSAYSYYADGTIQSVTQDGPSVFSTLAGSMTLTPSTASNWLNSTAGVLNRTYTHDAAGSITGDGGRTFTYNDAGRMISAMGGGVTINYLYNALGQRVKKSNASSTTYFVYDEFGHVLGEYDGNGTLIEEIVWLNDIPVASIRTNSNGTGVGVFYIHTDQLNAPTKLSEPATNTIVWRWDHDPYGSGVVLDDPDNNGQHVVFNLRFPGQYADQETGLNQNYFRDYDPMVPGYIESDPLGLGGGSFSTYAYATSDPIRYFDSDGLEVRVVGHIAAFPLGMITRPVSYHTAIYLNPDDRCGCPGSWPMTVGGQPEKHMLVTKFNYPDDALSNATFSQVLPTPSGMSDCEFINKIITAAKSYDNKTPYSFPQRSLMPGTTYMAPGDYNSNSYVAGVLQAAGVVPPHLQLPMRPAGGVPGYDNPLPIPHR